MSRSVIVIAIGFLTAFLLVIASIAIFVIAASIAGALKFEVYPGTCTVLGKE